MVTDEDVVVEKDVEPDLTKEPEPKPDEQVEAVPTTETTPEDNKIIINELVSNAVALLTTDDKANATQALRSLTDIDNQYPGHAEVAYNMGLAHLKMDEIEQARKEFLRSTDLDPTFSRSWYNLGL